MGILAEEETNKRYSIIDETFEHSPFPMFWCTDFNFVMANLAFCTLTEYTREQLKTMSFNSLIPDGSAQMLLNEIFDNTDKRDFKILTREIVTSTKKITHVELRITRVYLENGEKYYYGLLRPLLSYNANEDLFKEQHQLLHLALTAAKQGIWIWNAKNDETEYNTYAFAILGYPPDKKTPQGEDFIKLLHPDDVATSIYMWNNFLKGTDDFYTSEFRMLNHKQEYIWIKSTGRVVDRDKEGKPIRITGVLADINEQKLNQLLIKNQTQKLLNYAFFNSHQLRAPISSIMGLTELLKTEYSPEFITMLDKVVNQLDDAVHEINDLLWDKTNTNTHLNTPNGIKRITLIDNNQQLNIIYKNTFENFANTFNANAYTGYEKALDLLLKGQLDTDYILLDADDIKTDIWSFLNQYNKTPNCKPIYLITANIEITNVLKASEYSCIAGFLIKPVDKQDILNLIKKFNN
jgi:PAS domain S-box-containing protein